MPLPRKVHFSKANGTHVELHPDDGLYEWFRRRGVPVRPIDIGPLRKGSGPLIEPVIVRKEHATAAKELLKDEGVECIVDYDAQELMDDPDADAG